MTEDEYSVKDNIETKLEFMDNVFWRPLVEELNLDDLDSELLCSEREVKRTIKMSLSNKNHESEVDVDAEAEEQEKNELKNEFKYTPNSIVVLKEEDFYDNNYWKISPLDLSAEFDDLDLV
jgi:hypothetical protein